MPLECHWNTGLNLVHYPPASEASREVANLTEIKNPHAPVYGVKEFVRLSVTKFDPNYLRTGKAEWAEIFYSTSMAKRYISKFYICSRNAHFHFILLHFCIKNLQKAD